MRYAHRRNKTVHLGQAILDLSKLAMYKFHYDYMVPKYGENLKIQSQWTGLRPDGLASLWLCYMDTDSLIYHIVIGNDVVDKE